MPFEITLAESVHSAIARGSSGLGFKVLRSRGCSSFAGIKGSATIGEPLSNGCVRVGKPLGTSPRRILIEPSSNPRRVVLVAVVVLLLLVVALQVGAPGWPGGGSSVLIKKAGG